MFRRLNCVLWPTAFRLGEIVRHSSGEVMYLTRACLSWSIGWVILTDSTRAQIMALRSGDFVGLLPPRSKPDQWGEVHCPFPVILSIHDEFANAAVSLRDIKLLVPCDANTRSSTPLFADATGQPYTHSFLDLLLKTVLPHCFGATVARLFTWHSYRSGLACYDSARRARGRRHGPAHLPLDAPRIAEHESLVRPQGHGRACRLDPGSQRPQDDGRDEKVRVARRWWRTSLPLMVLRLSASMLRMHSRAG